MIRPFMNRFPVFEWDYQEKDIDVTIYSFYEKTPNEDYEEEPEPDYEKDDEESLSRRARDSILKNNITSKLLKDINLQSLIDNLPEDISPSDVKIKMDIRCSSMAVEGTRLILYYTKHLPARPDLYKKDKVAYDEEFEKYSKNKELYDAWLIEQEIKELENQIAKLKK